LGSFPGRNWAGSLPPQPARRRGVDRRSWRLGREGASALPGTAGATSSTGSLVTGVEPSR